MTTESYTFPDTLEHPAQTIARDAKTRTLPCGCVILTFCGHVIRPCGTCKVAS